MKTYKLRPDPRIAALAVGSLIIAAAFAALVFVGGRRSVSRAERVVIAVPFSEWVQDHNTNYYTLWLEEKTGCDIEFVYLEEGYERENIASVLTSRYSGVDAVFLPSDRELISLEDYRGYISGGSVAAPCDYLDDNSSLMNADEKFSDIDFGTLRGDDGKMYCFPSVRTSRTAQKTQILWINADWLMKLDLTMPRTADEFYNVLKAFRDNDPNGSGTADELPLVSCEAENSLKSYLCLLNAFTYYDAEHASLYAENGSLRTAAEQDGFFDGAAYCAELYEQGLLADDCFGFTRRQLAELVNDPADIVGAFACHSIADLVYTNNPDVLSRFVQLAPLSSEDRAKGFAVNADIIPGIGGLICANSTHKDAAARIMDLMLSDEASLIALYGEEGTDWRFSRDGELSTYGTRAVVTTLRYLKNERQNKNYAGAGPLLVSSEYTDGVTWNGDHSMTEYIDARAAKAYEEYCPAFSERDEEVLSGELARIGRDGLSRASEYLSAELLKLITGERDPHDENDRAGLIAGLAAYLK